MDSIPHQKQNTHNQEHQASKSELISSAKLVAEAAKATLNHETDKVDKGKVAEAAADLLDAASHYGKLEDNSFGKYMETAENYLHQYHSSSATTTTTSTHSPPASHSTPTHTNSPSGGDADSEGGYDKYFQMAGGFLKKH